MAETNCSSLYQEFCETMTKVKCDRCSGALRVVTGDGKDDQPLIYWCDECSICNGLDDTFSEEECRELTEFLQSALESGVLRAETCELCNNDCLGRFMFEHDEEDQRVSLKCMCCGQRKAIGDSGDDTADNHAAESADDQFPIVCDCGNHSRDLFSVNGGDDEDFVIFQCQVRDATFLLQTSFAEEKSRPTVEKPATVTVKDKEALRQPSGCTEISHLSQLRPGDHIYWNRSLGYSHHAIVIKVSSISGQVKVIQYSGGLLESKRTGSICEEWLDVDCENEPPYRQDYAHCNEPAEVVRRARCRLGERDYSLIFNNCEHFARWCKTGISQSVQVDETMRSIERTRNNIRTARKYGDLAYEAVKGRCELSKSWFDVAGLLATELVDVVDDTRKAYSQMAAGDISRQEFSRVRVERAASGLFAVIGAQAVALTLNSVEGMTLGAVIGRGISKIVVRNATKLFSGKP